MKYQAVKGMRDWYPEQKAVLSSIFDVLRITAQRFGFQEIESPAIESAQLLTAKSGEEIKQQLFVCEKKGSEELALRFDLTVPFTRMLVQKQGELPKPVKWFGISRMWRYEAPQKGRLREFYQLSVELFGCEKPDAEAECLQLLVSCLKNLGLQEKDFIIRLNNRKLLEGILKNYVREDKIDDAVRLIDKSSKISKEDFDFELAKITNQGDMIQQLVSIKGKPAEVLPKLKALKLNEEAQQGLVELEAVTDLLDLNCIRIDLSLARGLAYYTGTVFECFDSGQSLRAIAGGGRYDNLVQVFGGQACAAVGFAIGDVTLSLLLEEKGLLPKPDLKPEYYVCAVSDLVRAKAREIADKLRRTTRVEIDLMNRKFSKQMECANNLGVKKTIIVGEEELMQKKVRIKDMRTGAEELVLIDAL
ncbi:MAG: histidine--tRNA ligase [Candidatus Woesearchaeota archaeon]|nr:histidine--tRNA ligase [Candidatus Woesearchaeota archaeon]